MAFVVPADAVIFAIGQQPRTDLFTSLPSIRPEHGRVWVDENFRTTHPRVFAGGDCVNGGGTVSRLCSMESWQPAPSIA